jgi:hypothetical protein
MLANPMPDGMPAALWFNQVATRMLATKASRRDVALAIHEATKRCPLPMNDIWTLHSRNSKNL